MHLDHSTQHQLIIIILLEEQRTNLDNNFLVRAIFMESSKAVDYISHDLLMKKYSACGFKWNNLKLMNHDIRNMG